MFNLQSNKPSRSDESPGVSFLSLREKKKKALSDKKLKRRSQSWSERKFSSNKEIGVPIRSISEEHGAIPILHEQTTASGHQPQHPRSSVTLQLTSVCCFYTPPLSPSPLRSRLTTLRVKILGASASSMSLLSLLSATLTPNRLHSLFLFLFLSLSLSLSSPTPLFSNGF